MSGMKVEYQTTLHIFIYIAFETVFSLWNIDTDLKMQSEIFNYIVTTFYIGI